MTPIQAVNIGRGVVLLPPKIGEANLGSCLGIAMAWPEENRFGLVHVLLPNKGRHPTDNRYFRYASSAPGFLLKRMGVPPERVCELRAVIAGGADMYNAQKTGVGEQNHRAGLSALRALRIRVIARDVGGKTARRIRLNAGTGRVIVTQLHPNNPVERDWSLLI